MAERPLLQFFWSCTEFFSKIANIIGNEDTWHAISKTCITLYVRKFSKSNRSRKKNEIRNDFYKRFQNILFVFFQKLHLLLKRKTHDMPSLKFVILFMSVNFKVQQIKEEKWDQKWFLQKISKYFVRIFSKIALIIENEDTWHAILKNHLHWLRPLDIKMSTLAYKCFLAR